MVFHDQDDRNVGFLDQILTCKSSNAEDNIIDLLAVTGFSGHLHGKYISQMTWKRREMIWEGCGIDIDPIRWIGNETRILDGFELKIWSRFRWAEASQARKSVSVMVSVVNNRMITNADPWEIWALGDKNSWSYVAPKSIVHLCTSEIKKSLKTTPPVYWPYS